MENGKPANWLVAVIEYDEDVRESICEMLNMEGFEAAGFSTPTAALEALRSVNRPCLVFLELGMPLRDGWEFLLRRDQFEGAAARAPIFAFTAHLGDMRIPSEIRKVFPKPFACDDLLGALKAEFRAMQGPKELNLRYA